MKTLSLMLTCLLAVAGVARAQEASEKCVGGADGAKCGPTLVDDQTLHMELKKIVDGSKCGKLTFKKGKSKKKAQAEAEELEYESLKHSKVEEIDPKCSKKQLVKDKLLQMEGEFDALQASLKKIAKKMAMLQQAQDELRDELENQQLNADIKKKLRAAKKKLTAEIANTRSKCDAEKAKYPDAAMKCAAPL